MPADVAAAVRPAVEGGAQEGVDAGDGGGGVGVAQDGEEGDGPEEDGGLCVFGEPTELLVAQKRGR